MDNSTELSTWSMAGTETKICASCRNQFVIEPDDFGFYEQMHVPPPTWCSECRMIRRFSWWGYRILYRRKCDFTGEMMISDFHTDSPHKVYRQDVWWSDKWDAKSYGRDYDFNRSFFDQYRELLLAVPMPGLQTEYTSMVNSEYCNAAGWLKNCYLAFKIDYSEDCAYMNVISRTKQSFDLAYSYDDELCYEGFNLVKCYRAFYSQDCIECQDIYFCQDLIGCNNCFGCVNLKKKSYCIFNEQYTKEEYKQKLKEFDLGSSAAVKSLIVQAATHSLKYPKRAFRGRNNVNTSGDSLYNCKNVKDSFLIANAENIRYSQALKTGPAANCYDQSGFGMNSDWVYDSGWVGLSVNTVKFSFWNYTAHDLEYCFGCHGSGNLFGCVGLRKHEYCILNKQYSKEDYLALVDKIRKHMADTTYRDQLGREYRYGEFPPPEFAAWGWNETTGYEFFSFTKEEAMAQGLRWRDEDRREYKEATMVLSDHIKDVTDEILKAILKCDQCGKNYQIIPMELQFLRRFVLPIPRQCPLCRDRVRLRPLKDMVHIYDRTCAKCGKAIKTSYASERPEIIYCEHCYQAEVA